MVIFILFELFFINKEELVIFKTYHYFNFNFSISLLYTMVVRKLLRQLIYFPLLVTDLSENWHTHSINPTNNGTFIFKKICYFVTTIRKNVDGRGTRRKHKLGEKKTLTST